MHHRFSLEAVFQGILLLATLLALVAELLYDSFAFAPVVICGVGIGLYGISTAKLGPSLTRGWPTRGHVSCRFRVCMLLLSAVFASLGSLVGLVIGQFLFGGSFGNSRPNIVANAICPFLGAYGSLAIPLTIRRVLGERINAGSETRTGQVVGKPRRSQ